jgi:pyruvate kinase
VVSLEAALVRMARSTLHGQLQGIWLDVKMISICQGLFSVKFLQSPAPLQRRLKMLASSLLMRRRTCHHPPISRLAREHLIYLQPPRTSLSRSHAPSHSRPSTAMSASTVAFASGLPLRSHALPVLRTSGLSSPAFAGVSSVAARPSAQRARWTAVAAVQKRAASGAEDALWALDASSGRRLSKIVCTLGPKTCDVPTIEALAEQGMDVVRLNMSHGTHEWHKAVIEAVRVVNGKGRFNLGILLDTKGPEVRSGDLRAPINVSRGQRFVFTIRSNEADFGNDTVGVSYDDFVNDVHVGDTLLVDGGMCSFLCIEVTETDVVTECVDGGQLTSRRHLNVRGKSASLPAITDKDWEDIAFGIEHNVDFYALSFVKHEDDVAELKRYLVERDVHALVLSKIESADAVKRLRPILEASDGAMVARGDLGAEIPVEEVPLVQEEIVRINRILRRPTIVATHMLESMITYPTPTRAEVTDITEAVRQGADATMLSGETANGAYPLKAINVMATVAESVVSQDSALSDDDLFAPIIRQDDDGVLPDPRVDLAYSASTLANRLDVAAIVVFTRVGTYANFVASTRPRCPIIALTPDPDLVRRLTLLWGVRPFELEFSDDPEDTIARAVDLLTEKGLCSAGDLLVITSDMLTKHDKVVDALQIRRVHG